MLYILVLMLFLFYIWVIFCVVFLKLLFVVWNWVWFRCKLCKCYSRCMFINCWCGCMIKVFWCWKMLLGCYFVILGLLFRVSIWLLWWLKIIYWKVWWYKWYSVLIFVLVMWKCSFLFKGVMMNLLIIKLGGVLLDSEEVLECLFSVLVNYCELY